MKFVVSHAQPVDNVLKLEPLAKLSQKRILSILTQEWARSEKILFIAHHQETEAEYKSHMLSESKTTFFVHIQMNEKTRSTDQSRVRSVNSNSS